MDYIRFNVDGQRLDYSQKYYSSTDTINTLYCNFKFETDDLGHVRGGWNLPFIWAQFHDEKGNVYVKAVEDNTCSIPFNCLKQLKFKMTLFATDTENYMSCTKRYTTNEIAFRFKGDANINYDGGVSPDEPMPTNWKILLDRVDECESDVDGLSQDVSAISDRVDTLSQDVSTIGDRVDTLSQDVATMGNKVDGIDERVTANTTAIDGLTQDVTSIYGTLDDLSTELDAETTARETADANLQSAINDRYTKAGTDALVNAESTARANADAELQSAIQAEATARSEAIEGVNGTVNELNTKLDDESTARTNADTNLQSLINDRYTKAETNALLDAESAAREAADTNLQSLITAESAARTNADTRLEGLINAESTARENADADLRLLINDEINERTSSYNALQQSIGALDDRVTNNTNDIDGINTTVELLYKTLKKDNSWAELVELISSGEANKFLKYGDQIEEDWIDVDNNKAYSNAWDVAKFDDSVESEDGSTFKGMYLKMHYAMLKGVQSSHQRAFYAASDGLEAGTYNITFGADWGKAKNGKTYQFTLSQAVEKGGRLAGFYGMPDTEPTTWKVYNYGADGKTLKETVSVIEGSEGTSLGTLKINSRDGNLNSMQETGYGCNDWEISAMRQYLNSRAGKGAWWIAQDQWDIAPDQLNTTSGFLSGVSDDFYNSMRTVKVTTVKNNPTYAGEVGVTYDKVFLPSLEEMYVNPQKTGEGSYYPLMKATCGLETPMAQYGTYPKIITYALENHASAQHVRLRSANVGNACNTWYVYSSGIVGYGSASSAGRACPVCVIG